MTRSIAKCQCGIEFRGTRDQVVAELHRHRRESHGLESTVEDLLAELELPWLRASREHAAERGRTFVVVARATSAARVPEEARLAVGATTPVGPAVMVFRTRWVDEGHASPVPRELWVEVTGQANALLDDVVNAYLTCANEFAPIIATVTNAPIDDFDIHFAFDGTLESDVHEFFENFLPDERGRPRHGRNVPFEHVDAFLTAFSESTEQARLIRACTLYREALRYLKPGQEVLFVAFLWMTVEALTKVAVRRGCIEHDCDESGLVIAWELARSTDSEQDLRNAKKGLDGEARRRLIFHGDANCMQATKRASDAFEHSFKAFGEIRALALAAKNAGVAEHVRRAIFELSNLNPSSLAALTSGQYAKPRANWLMTMYLRGEFAGRTEDLAPADGEYPILTWEARIKRFEKQPDGTHTIEFDETISPRCGEGVVFRPLSREVWGPEKDPRSEPDGEPE